MVKYTLALLLAVSAWCHALSPGAEEYLKVLFYNDFGYTLIGVKPVSANFGPLYDKKRMRGEDRKEVSKFLREIFDRSGRFFLVSSSLLETMVDSRAVEKLFDRSMKFRKYVIKHYGSVGYLLYSFKRSNKGVVEFFRNDREILSLVLGYGEQNGVKYQQDHLKVYLFEKNDLREGKTRAADLLNYFALPFYFSYDCDESVKLKEKYSLARERLVDLFSGKVPSEVISEVVLCK